MHRNALVFSRNTASLVPPPRYSNGMQSSSPTSQNHEQRKLASIVAWPVCAARLESIAGLLLDRQARGFSTRFDANDFEVRDDGSVCFRSATDKDALFGGSEAAPALGVMLTDIAHRALTGRPVQAEAAWPPLLPPSVRRFLDALSAMTAPAEVLDRLALVRHVPEQLSTRRRLHATAVAAAPGAFVALLLATILADEMLLKVPRDVRRLRPLLEYVVPSEDARERRESSSHLEVSARRRHRDSLMLEREHTVGIHLLSTERELLRDTVGRQRLVKRSYDWRTVDSLLSVLPSISADDSARAAQLVQVTLRGNPFNVSEPLFARLTPSFVLVTLTGTLSLFAAVTVRRGIAMRLARLEVLTRTGRRAGRIRLVLRTLGNTLPVLPIAPLLYCGLAWHLPIALLTDSLLLLHLGLGLSILVVITRHPTRSPGDVLAGTWTVPA